MRDRANEGNPLRLAGSTAEVGWGALVAANREQVERLREPTPPTDHWESRAQFFRADPDRTDDASLNALLDLARRGDAWMEVGAGGGRYALGVARKVSRFTAVEPSESMRGVLEETRQEFGIENLTVIAESWPLPKAAPNETRVDVAMLAHVSYDIESIGPFLDALEASAGRMCAALLFEYSPFRAYIDLWEAIHGEPGHHLPALREFVPLLLARGSLPEVRIVDERSMAFDSLEDAQVDAARRLWLTEGSDKYHRMVELLPMSLEPRGDGGYVVPGVDRVGLVTWAG